MQPPPEIIQFARFEFHKTERRLYADGKRVLLGSRALEVLGVLVDRPCQLVTKEQLLDIVWPGLAIQENSLAAQVSALRKTLGADFIATVPGRGYRFTPAVSLPTQPSSDRPPLASWTPTAPPPRPGQRTNLPAPVPAFVGRRQALVALDALAGEHCLVTVVGPGGMGKSRLVQALLHTRQGQYTHGVCWVELANVSDAAALPGVVAAALGLHLGTGTALQAWAQSLEHLHMLVALDNAEHLLADVAHLVHTLWLTAPRLSLIITSQAPLKLHAESVYRLEPLSVPDEPVSAAEASSFDALTLFEHCARRTGHPFALDDSTVLDCIALCRSLDGMPLAIELAAARMPVLGLRGLMSSLQQRLKVLTVHGDRLAPARQQTLRATLDWSHDLLAPRERALFRRLGVVVGSASLALIQRLAAADRDEADAWDTVDALQVLTERSLLMLTPSEEHPAAEPRYRMLQSTRAYALEQLERAGELSQVRRLHAQAMADLFAAAWPARWDGREPVTHWRRRLQPDLDNAHDALHWADAQAEAMLVQRIGITLLYAMPSSQHRGLLAVADICLGHIAADLPSDLRLVALLALAYIWMDTHRQRSEAAVQQALPLARDHAAATGDSYWLYAAQAYQAVNAAYAGDTAAARLSLDDMRGIEDPHWPPHKLLTGAYSAGGVATASGDVATGLTCWRKALRLAQASGVEAQSVLINLMDAETAAGQAKAAVLTGTALLEQLRCTRSIRPLSFARLNLMAAWLALDKPARARALAEAGLADAMKMDIAMWWADHLSLLAALESRYAAAALLAGYSDRRYEAHELRRVGNEATSMRRAEALASKALGTQDYQRLRSEGAWLADADFCRLALNSPGPANAQSETNSSD